MYLNILTTHGHSEIFSMILIAHSQDLELDHGLLLNGNTTNNLNVILINLNTMVLSVTPVYRLEELSSSTTNHHTSTGLI
jgi:hypothetical protein